MRLKSFISLFIVSLFVGCSKEKTELFVDNYFIKFYFGKSDVEEYYRMNYSFAMVSDTVTRHEIKIPVEYMGKVLEHDLSFKVKIDLEKTTLPADCYQLDLEQLFHAGIGSVDTLRLNLLRKPVLKEESKLLRVQLISGNDFQVYMPDSLYVEIHVSDIYSRPEWWDNSVEKAYLGTYSKKKYDEFVKETGVWNFGELDPSGKRYYSMLFKRALEKEPRTDENDELMTVTIPG